MSQVAWTDETRMTFGVHKNQKMKNVPAQYLDWLMGQAWVEKSWPGLWQYLMDNKESIHAEIDDEQF